jgi:hypothetical protein
MKKWNCSLLHQSLIVTYESDLAWVTPINQCGEDFVLKFLPKGNYQR